MANKRHMAIDLPLCYSLNFACKIKC